MFVIRGLIWLAIVALLMPRAPQLRLEHLRDALIPADAVVAVHSPSPRVQAVERAVHLYRDAVLRRLARVHAELRHSGAVRAADLDAPAIFRPTR